MGSGIGQEPQTAGISAAAADNPAGQRPGLLDSKWSAGLDRSGAIGIRRVSRTRLLPRPAAARAHDPRRRSGHARQPRAADLLEHRRHARADRRVHAAAERTGHRRLQPDRLGLPADDGHRARGRPRVHRPRHDRHAGCGHHQRDAGAPAHRRPQPDRRTDPSGCSHRRDRRRRPGRQVHGRSPSIFSSPPSSPRRWRSGRRRSACGWRSARIGWTSRRSC